MTMPSEARPAATVVVLRPAAAAFEVLLVRRHDQVAFMGGAFVFPGGRVDAADREGAAGYAFLRDSPRFPDISTGDELAYRRAAVRELREEASVSMEVDALSPIAHWVTPEIEIRRYDTRFFLGVMPPGQEARHDEGEMTDLAWCSPRGDAASSTDVDRPAPARAPSHAGVRAGMGSHHAHRARAAELHRGRWCADTHAAGRSLVSGDSRLGRATGDAVPAAGRPRMAADLLVTARVDELVALFNRRSLDLPDGLFDRRTQFLLNGTPFEAMLGRPPADPLVLMIARGPSGYRFAIKALQHAVPDARVERGAVEGNVNAAPTAAVVPLWLSGRLRVTDQPLETLLRVSIVVNARGTITQADAAIDPDVLGQLREARLRE
jgi:8-oxo-dGTP pyrophosphatase MutT (NUDIX family)